MDPSQSLIDQLTQQAQEQRQAPPEVLEDTINEAKEYEKSLLQGVGGLVAGSSVEKGFKALANSKKGVATLKKLGMSDEDVSQVVSAIKSRDASSLTEFLTRKGTGYVNKLGKNLGVKGKQALSKLKKGEVPTRQDLQDAINSGGGDTVNPTTSNRSSSKALGEDADEDGLSAFEKIIAKGKNAIKGTTKSLEDSLGDIPSKLSKQASSIGNDARDIVRGTADSAKSISKPNSLFDRARAEFQGDDDLAGQADAVKKLLSNSKKGRSLLRRNAKAKAEGKPTEKQPSRNPTEFDDEDEQGDLLSELIKVKRAKPPTVDLPTQAQELNPFTNEPSLSPQQKIDALKQKIDNDTKSAQEQIENEGDRDPYQDIYDQAKRVSERFTPKQPTGEPMKQDLDLRFKAPTEEEAKAQYRTQEQGQPEPMLKTDEDDADLKGSWDDDEDVANVVQNEAPTVSVPPSQQTGGLDPSKLPDDAGFKRGSAKIQAKKEVDVPKQEAGLDTDVPASAGKLVPPKPEPNLPPNDLQPSSTLDREAVRTQTQLDESAVRQGRNIPVGGGAKAPTDDPEPQAPKPPQQEAPQPPPPEDGKPKPLDDPDLPPVNPEEAEEAGSAVKKGLTKAFEESLEGDADPFGVVLSGVLGIGALIAGAFGKSHHPHFVQPPITAPQESYSVQEGVA